MSGHPSTIEDLLTRAADVPVVVDVAADLRRARTDLRRRRRRTLAGTGSGALAVAVVAVAVTAAGGVRGSGAPDRTAPAASSPASPTSTPTSTPTPTPVAPPHESGGSTRGGADDPSTGPDGRVHTGPFVLPPAPAGWHVVGARLGSAYLTLAGSTVDLSMPRSDHLVEIDVLDGSFSQAVGSPTEVDGRAFWVDHDPYADMTRVSVQRDDGGWISLLYPDSAGFSEQQMVSYLAGTRVDADALDLTSAQ